MPRSTAIACFLACVAAGSRPAAGQDGDTTMSLRRGAYTEAQARRGEALYRDRCAECHAPEFFTESLIPSWRGAPLSMLFDVIRATMPEDRPGSLEPREYADVLAYIFELNGLPAGRHELPFRQDQLARIVIDRRE